MLTKKEFEQLETAIYCMFDHKYNGKEFISRENCLTLMKTFAELGTYRMVGEQEVEYDER